MTSTVNNDQLIRNKLVKYAKRLPKSVSYYTVGHYDGTDSKILIKANNDVEAAIVFCDHHHTSFSCWFDECEGDFCYEDECDYKYVYDFDPEDMDERKIRNGIICLFTPNTVWLIKHDPPMTLA